MISRPEFAIFCWLTIGTFLCLFGLLAMVRVDWVVVKQAWRRWRDSR